MRLPTIEADFWTLRSAELSHEEDTDQFQIPPADARNSLMSGQSAKLIFDIAAYDELGQVEVRGERMWVIVSERVDGYYIGLLDSQPPLNPSDNIYLVFGAEIPFLPEHVIDIAKPPKKYQDWQLSQPPEREWPRS